MNDSLKKWIFAIIPLWFLLALVGSLLGVFDSQHRPPATLGIAAVLPVLLFAACYLGSPRFRQVILRADIRLLTLAQTWRVAGLVFVLLYYRGMLPAAFALPAGWGDFAIGVTAPLIAFGLSHRK